MNNDILLPMSCDPPHFGHLNLIADALRFRDGTVYVAILPNTAKTPLFSAAERKEMLEKSLDIAASSTIENFSLKYVNPSRSHSWEDSDWGIIKANRHRIRVITPSESLPDTHAQLGRPSILRGYRSEKERTKETAQSMLFHKMDLITWNHWIIHPSTNELSHISSSVVKGAVLNHFFVPMMVFPHVERALWEAIHGIRLWSITGPMASGKSTLCNALKDNFGVNTILVDEINREVWQDDCPASQHLREVVASVDPEAILNQGVDFKRLRLLFAEGKLSDLQTTIEDLVKRKLRMKLRGAPSGIVLIEWAQLAQMKLGHWSQGHVVVLDTPPETQEKYLEARARERGEAYDPKFLEQVRSRQSWGTDQIIKNLHSQTLGGATILKFRHQRDDIRDLWAQM